MIKAQPSSSDMAAHTAAQLAGNAWPPHALPNEADDIMPAISAAEFRDALAYAATAVTVLATAGPAGIAGVTCSAVCSVCDTPATILFCVNRGSAANSVLKANGFVSVNWLNSQQADVSQLFAGIGHVPMQNRFEDERWQTSAHGVPYRASHRDRHTQRFSRAGSWGNARRRRRPARVLPACLCHNSPRSILNPLQSLTKGVRQ